MIMVYGRYHLTLIDNAVAKLQEIALSTRFFENFFLVVCKFLLLSTIAMETKFHASPTFVSVPRGCSGRSFFFWGNRKQFLNAELMSMEYEVLPILFS